MVALRTDLVAPQRSHRRRSRSLLRTDVVELDFRDRVDPTDLAARPRTRGDCQGHTGPCPWVSCRHHLYLDVNEETGTIKLNFPDVSPDELDRLPATCALDVADAGGLTLEEVGERMALTRERVRQLEAGALRTLRRSHAAGTGPEGDDA